MDEITKSILSLISPESRLGLLFLTGSWLLALSLLFLAAFVYPIPFVREAIDQLGLPDWVYAGMLVVAVHGLVVFVNSNDVLAYGNPASNKFSAAFQRNYPQTLIADELHLDPQAASHLWFTQFNTWADPKHPKHQDRSRTFKRGYACRFVYYVQTAARRLFWLAALWLATEWILRTRFGLVPSQVEAQVLVTLILASVWLTLRFLNRLGATSRGGVWRRFDEVNLMHRKWVEANLQDIGAGQVVPYAPTA